MKNKESRRVRNREAVRKCRARKVEHYRRLEEEVQKLRFEVEQLRTQRIQISDLCISLFTDLSDFDTIQKISGIYNLVNS